MMLAAGTFELIDVFEIAVMIAIPVVLIWLLVRSFREPKAAKDGERAEASPSEQ